MSGFYISVFLIYGLTTIPDDAIKSYSVLAAARLHSPLESRTIVTAALLLKLILSIGTISAAAVATHRFILLDESRPKIRRNTARFFLWLVFVLAILVLLDVMRSLERAAMPDSGLTVMIGGAIWIVKLVVAIHFAPLFPPVALGENAGGWRKRIAASWARMEGNFWLFLTGDLVALFPFIVALAIVAIVSIGFEEFGMARGQRLMPAPHLWVWTVSIFRDFLEFPMFMVQAAIASWLYAWVRQTPAEPEVTP
jgi:hypothetical protein